MHAKPLVLLALIASLGLTACAAAATPIANSPRPTAAPVVQTQIVSQTQVVNSTTQLYPATAAPAATQIAQVVYPTSAPAPTEWSQTAYATTAPYDGAPTPGPTPGDMNFQNYGVNPFVDTAEDHLSTFALDVDTASYTLARSYIEEGRMPPPDAVRPEEFINYFKQGYNPPSDVAFGVYADGAPSYYNADGSYLLRFGIQGYSVPDSERQPANLTFVIDVSGSMAMTNRLELVKRSLELLVERLRPPIPSPSSSLATAPACCSAPPRAAIRPISSPRSIPCSRKVPPTPKTACAWVTAWPTKSSGPTPPIKLSCAPTAWPTWAPPAPMPSCNPSAATPATASA